MSTTLKSGKTLITPKNPHVELWGYGGKKRLGSGISDELEANIAVLKEESGKGVVLVALDLLFGSDELEEFIKQSVMDAGLGDFEVIVAASHTHFAPCIDSSFPKIGEIVAEYKNWLFSRVTEETVRILKDGEFETFRLEYGCTPCEAGINRRKICFLPSAHPPFLKREVLFLPNPKGEKDSILRLIVMTTSSGRKVVFWSFGCHPVCHPDHDKISSDFPGAVRDHIRNRWGNDTSVLFFQGFSANVRPSLTTRAPRNGKEVILSTIFRSQFFKKPTTSEYRQWLNEIFHAIDTCLEGTRNTEASGLAMSYASIPMTSLMDEYNGPRSDLKLRGIRIGKEISMIFVSAEVVAEYAAVIKSILGSEKVMMASCVGSNLGYLPTERIREEGGYEGGQFLHSFGLAGRYKPGCEREFASAVERIKMGLSPQEGF